MPGNNSKAGRPTKAEALVILQRRDRVMKALVAGKTQQDIAAVEKLDEAQISRDLKWCRAQLAESVSANTAEHKGLVVAWIMEQRIRYLAGYERSRQQRKKTSTKTFVKITAGKVEAGKPPAPKAEAVKKMVVTDTETERDGNPKFLNGMDAMEREYCRVNGLYAPVKIAPTNPTGTDEYAGSLDAGEAAALLREIAARVGADLGGPDHPPGPGAAGSVPPKA